MNGPPALQHVEKDNSPGREHVDVGLALKLILLKPDDVSTDHVIILIFHGLTGLLVRLVHHLIAGSVVRNVMVLLIIVKVWASGFC